jgi:hypothetical protein
MPETPQEFYERVTAAAGPDGRLPVSADVAESEIFPFESDGFRVKVFERPVVPEPPRNGDPGGSACHRCELGESGAFWADERWMLVPPGDSMGGPFAALLMPREHVDFGDVEGQLAADLGPLMVAIERAVKALGNIARVHVNIWGDGGSHFHVWFFARPLGALQLRGSCMPDWLDLLPPVPADLLAADRRAVAETLAATYGGKPLSG